ncbi:HD domain-containing protein [Tepidibacter aestuarii]|uniref:HD domain-containing protein n=1 Tax=Tepidibacter aestuarii TaxID=2925782 RepID=UPI0020C0587B|nr:HD domain-containing protein [Tepidibacter aestuarii]CAH2213286.1 HD domain-containing protein [Tepidibacter aestuarii]
MNSNLEGKVIRDCIHGDIFLSDNFLKIIDTPEFQRLRRIRQLAIVNLLFPCAEHTRFSHCLGTFHIMRRIIEHFEKEFENINMSIDSRDKEVALAAALLHDIGHGPFSHTFEEIYSNKSMNHEMWTIRIITDKSTTLNKVLVENFDEDFPEDVARLIDKSAYKQNYSDEKIDLNFILSSLVSSQIDADRMDYIMRDSVHTGVSYGKIDISRIIKSMTIKKNENKYFLCIYEKYLPDIESYLLSRYQMHKGIYNHSFKCEMEGVIKKIFFRMKELFKFGKLNEYMIPNGIIPILTDREYTLEEYISTDDYTLLYLFSELRRSEDLVLSKLCKCVIDRNKFEQIDNNENIEPYKSKLIHELQEIGYEVKDLKKEYFWLEVSKNYSAYETNKDNILVYSNKGKIKDLAEVSNIISPSVCGRKTDIFINYDILKNINKI